MNTHKMSFAAMRVSVIASSAQVPPKGSTQSEVSFSEIIDQITTSNGGSCPGPERSVHSIHGDVVAADRDSGDKTAVVDRHPGFDLTTLVAGHG